MVKLGTESGKVIIKVARTVRAGQALPLGCVGVLRSCTFFVLSLAHKCKSSFSHSLISLVGFTCFF